MGFSASHIYRFSKLCKIQSKKVKYKGKILLFYSLCHAKGEKRHYKLLQAEEQAVVFNASFMMLR